MSLTGERQYRYACALLALGLVPAIPFTPLAFGQAEPKPAAAEPKPIKIKNGHTIRVVLGRKREPAAGIRPEVAAKDNKESKDNKDGGKDGKELKDGWQLQLTPDLAGAAAELEDVTPDVPGSHWVVPVAEDKVVLDSERFLPTHVYRVDFRRERKLLGSVLVYLYPPPEQKTARVEFSDQKSQEENPSALAPTPKGGLSDDRSTARNKGSR